MDTPSSSGLLPLSGARSCAGSRPWRVLVQPAPPAGSLRRSRAHRSLKVEGSLLGGVTLTLVDDVVSSGSNTMVRPKPCATLASTETSPFTAAYQLDGVQQGVHYGRII